MIAERWTSDLFVIQFDSIVAIQEPMINRNNAYHISYGVSQGINKTLHAPLDDVVTSIGSVVSVHTQFALDVAESEKDDVLIHINAGMMMGFEEKAIAVESVFCISRAQTGKNIFVAYLLPEEVQLFIRERQTHNNRLN